MNEDTRRVLDLAGTSPNEIDVESSWEQRWRAGRHRFTHPSGGLFEPARYAVEAIDELTAKRYVTTNHYSGSYPAASRRYGLFESTGSGPVLRGVMVLGIPVQTKALTCVLPDLEPFRGIARAEPVRPR